MKAISKYILGCLASILFVGCIEAELVDSQSDAVTIEASMEVDVDTKTTLSELTDGMYYPLWAENDCIAIYADGGEIPSGFVLKQGAGTTDATFVGDCVGDELLAIYPYDISGRHKDGNIYLTLPQEQEYVSGSFGPGAFPMIAMGTLESGLKFKNLAAVLKISMKGKSLIKSITLTANDKATSLSGPAAVKTDYEDEPQLTMSEGASSSVVLNVNAIELSETDETDFFIVVPAQTYKGGLTLTIDAYTEVVTKTISSDITFNRSQVRAIKGLELYAEIPEISIDKLPDNEIWYITEDGKPVYVTASGSFGANVVSNTYKEGKGVVVFDGTVTELPMQMFIDAEKVTAVYLPKTVAKIDKNPLRDIDRLTYIYSVLATEDNKSLILDGTLHSVAKIGVEEYVTPPEVSKIAYSAMHRMPELKKLVISEGVTIMEERAVEECNELEEVHLPSSLSDMSAYAFMCNLKLKGFYGDNQMITDDNLALVKDNYNNLGMRTLLQYASGADLTSYSIPEDVQLISNYAFYAASNLREVTFPEGIKLASGDAFYKTYNIERLYGPDVNEDGISLVVGDELRYVAPKGLVNYTTPSGVTRLDYGVLSDKPELKTVVFSDEVLSVGSAITCRPYEIPLGYILFECPSLESVTISANMRILGMDPFGIDPSTMPENLKSVYVRAAVPPILGHNFPETIPTIFEGLTIYVPESSLEAYLSSPDWEPYKGFIKGYQYQDLPESDVYVSTDYSNDGKVVKLQDATVGNGIDVILMGDAYSDRQVAGGFYEEDMEHLYANLFTEEPFKSFKEYFNVYYVNVVSATEGYAYGNTALDTWFGEGTEVGGSHQSVIKYALKAITENRMDEAMVVVAMNSDEYAGTCYMYKAEQLTDYASGLTISYFPRGGSDDTFAQLLHHEANGHGFAKLGDEYSYESNGAVTDEYKAEILDYQENRGWWRNVDFTSDPANVRWNHFLKDDRYAAEGLGAYEGGLTYWTGVWRPTENSIMRYNVGGFNAPSREAIYYRINKLAYGKDWEYDYEDFVEYDAINRSSSAESASVARSRRSNYVEVHVQPTAPPVVVGKSWRDAE